MSGKVYIDRDALLEAAKATDAYFQIKALLTDLPAADVAPREYKEMTFKSKPDEYIAWCRHKLTNKPRWIRENKYKNGYEDAMLAVMSMLHNEKSSADEWAKVKRAKWLKRQNEMTCSACKFIYYSNNDHFNYCPNCGARMEAKK